MLIGQGQASIDPIRFRGSGFSVQRLYGIDITLFNKFFDLFILKTFTKNAQNHGTAECRSHGVTAFLNTSIPEPQSLGILNLDL
jgi:hypothetical protein